MIIPIILAGGSGTRLWPLSRQLYPKQLIRLVDDNTLLQNTLLRLQGLDNVADPMVICHQDHRFMVAEQIREIDTGTAAIILEPAPRNTAPAIAVAALQAAETDPDAVLLVLPADHVIDNLPAFHGALDRGYDLARQNRLITFGIVPTAPETGYGYICKGRARDEENQAFALEKFVEKPDLETAETYLASGQYCWNSGMFMFKASLILDELAAHAPAIVTACRASLDKSTRDLDFLRLDPEAFAACPSDSIDYAVMEKTGIGAVIPIAAGWNDLGSWEALWQTGKKDDHSNVIHGDVLMSDVTHSYLHAESRAKLSLQKHFHRAEHWTVVSGTAIVTRDDEQILLKEDQSTYIPLGAVHRMENPGQIPLELIEVQSGPYLGEDDIVRFDDVYGRSNNTPGP